MNRQPLKLVFTVLFGLAAAAQAQVTFLDDDFEDGNLAGWTEGAGGDWANSTDTPINGSRSLKHDLTSVAGVSYIYAQPTYNLATERTIWRFQLANEAWDPSSGNKFWVYLMANEANLDSATVDGYAVGVQLANTGTPDPLTLWRVANGSAAATIIASALDWGSGDVVGVEVTRTTAGEWELKYDANGGFDNLLSAGTATDAVYTDTSYFGLVFTYSSTRAGRLRMDDVLIQQAPAPANEPPMFDPVGDQTVLVSNTLNFAVSATEPDNELITLTASNLPAHAFFFPTNGLGASTGTLQFTPDESQGSMSFDVDFYAADSDGVTVTTVTLNVQAPTECGVLFSEYVEGTSFNKALEIYNGSDFTIDLDAQGYLVQIYGNGSATPTITINLEGSLRSQKTHVLVHLSAGSLLTALADQIDNINFNGDDAIVLRSGGAAGPILDSIGQVGVDPGTRWGSPPNVTVDATLRRKISVLGGDSVADDAFDPVNEWDAYPQDTFDGIGEHDNGCGTPAPAESIYNSMSLVGTFNGFDPSNTYMHLIDDDVWQVVVTNINSSPNLFKFVANTNFSATTVWGDTNQIALTLPVTETAELADGLGNDIVVSEDLTGFFSFTFDDQALDYSVQRAVPGSMTVAGTFNNWELTPNMTLVSGSLWQASFNFVNETNLEFKFTANGTWDQNWGETNQTDFIMPVNGVAEPFGFNMLIPGPLNGVHIFRFNSETLNYTVDLDTNAVITFFMDFDAWDGASGSYGDYKFQGWSVTNVLIDELNALDGQVARIRDTAATAESHWIMSPSNSSGLGFVNFWYRNWDGSPAIAFDVQKSANGAAGSWSTVETLAGITTTSYVEHTTFISDPNSHFVRIKKVSGSERLLIDEIFVTSDTNTASVIINNVAHDPPLPFTNDEVVVSANVFPFNGVDDLEVRMFYRIGGDTNIAFTPVEMSQSGFTYAAVENIPAQSVGTQVFYYIQADFTGPGSESTSPTRFPSGNGLLSYGIPRNAPGTVWINEIDYIGISTAGFFDATNEFIELAGEAGADISGWSIELLDGSSTEFVTYDTYPIPGSTVLVDEFAGYGFWVLGMVGVPTRDLLLTNFLSNTLPGGVKLLNEFGGIEQVIAYGGSIPNYESQGGIFDPDTLFTPPNTNSVALTGTGGSFDEFAWSTNGTSPGVVNPGQNLSGDLPIILCTPLSFSCTNEVPAATEFVGLIATGTCGDLTVTLSFVPPQTDNGGAGCPADPLTITRRYRAVSNCDTTNECVQTITVSDSVDPVFLTCPPPVVSNANSSCQAHVPDFTGGAVLTDDCDGNPGLTQLPVPGTVVGTGNNLITLTATDVCGNASSCIVTMRVVEATPPTIDICAEDMTTECRADASDNASFGVYVNGWQTGDNGGTGWEGWTLVTNATGVVGHFPGDSRNNGSMNDSNGDSDINTVGFKAWGLFATGGSNYLSEAFRPLEEPLLVGNTFSIDMDNGFVDSGGAVGFALQNNGTGETRMEVIFSGGASNYSLQDSRGFFDSGLPYTDEGIQVRIRLTGSDSFSARMTRLVDETSVVVTGALMGTPGRAVDRLRLFNFSAGGGSAYDAFFNSIAVNAVPPVEPLDVTASDNCSTVTVTHISDVSGGACPEVVTRVYRATDASGNFVQCTQTITVADTIAPTLVCTGAVIVATSADCAGTVPDLSTNVLADDFCGGVVVTQVPAVGTALSIGTNLVTVMATDACGNSSNCPIEVVLADLAPPAISCQVQDGNVLLNPSFENGGGAGTQVLDDWTGFGSYFMEASAPRSGAFHAKMFGQFDTNLNLSGLFQDYPTSIGKTWRGAARILAPSTDPLSGGNKGLLKLEFYNAATNLVDEVYSRFITASVVQDVYGPISATGTAPGDTAFVRFVLLFQQEDDMAGGSFFYDDARLELVQTSLMVGDVGDVPAVDTEYILAEDNCDFTPTITHQGDSNNGGSGAMGDPLIITRTFRATDDDGNFAECAVTITVEASATQAPDVEITEVTVITSNFVIKSSGTNAWDALPEFATNILINPQMWLPIPGFSNIFLDGTNTLTFPFPTNPPPVYIRILNEQ